MQTKLTTEEIFVILRNRFAEYQCSGNGHPANRNPVTNILKDFVESFSEGQLKVVTSGVTVHNNISVRGNIEPK